MTYTPYRMSKITSQMSPLYLDKSESHFLTLLFIYFRFFSLPEKKTKYSNCCTAASPVALPPYPPLVVLGAPPPAMSIDCRWRWGPIIGREWRRVRPVIAPPPSLPRRRFNSDHAGKRYVLGRNRESRSRPGNCDF